MVLSGAYMTESTLYVSHNLPIVCIQAQFMQGLRLAGHSASVTGVILLGAGLLARGCPLGPYTEPGIWAGRRARPFWGSAHDPWKRAHAVATSGGPRDDTARARAT